MGYESMTLPLHRITYFVVCLRQCTSLYISSEVSLNNYTYAFTDPGGRLFTAYGHQYTTAALDIVRCSCFIVSNNARTKLSKRL